MAEAASPPFPMIDDVLATDPGLPNPSSTHSFWHTPPNSFLHAHRTTAALPSSVETIIIGSGVAGSMLFHHLQRFLGLSTNTTPSSSSSCPSSSSSSSSSPFPSSSCSSSPSLLPPSSPSPPPSSTLMLEARNTCWGATGRNGGHCKPMLYQSGEFLDLCRTLGEEETLKRIRFEQLNLQLVKEYVSLESVRCEWADSPSADVYFEREPFELAKRCIDALAALAPDIASHLRVVEDRRELRETLRTPTALGAVVFVAGKLSPYKLVSHILEKAVKFQGLNLQTTTPALSVTRSPSGKGWAVATPRGTVLAKRVVFATNAHTAHLLPVFKGWIYPVRAQMSALIPPKSLCARPLTHTYGLVRRSRKTACYLIQRSVDEDGGGGGELLLGGGRELEERQGVGLQDGAINDDIAERLRSSISGYFADETGYGSEEPLFEENRELQRSFIEKFRQLRLGGHDVWDAAEGLSFDRDDDNCGEHDSSEGRRADPGPPPALLAARGTKEQAKGEECKARMEWSGTMGFSRDSRPFVGRVPAVGEVDAQRLGIEAMPDTRGLWILAGFEGHGMALTTGSAKALAAMLAAEEANSGTAAEKLFDWFPREFEVTPARLGLLEEEEWEELERGGGVGAGSSDDWELVDKDTFD